jgi:hypothetical protein
MGRKAKKEEISAFLKVVPLHDKTRFMICETIERFRLEHPQEYDEAIVEYARSETFSEEVKRLLERRFNSR